jgi:Flp pilus assembly pilin Flp
MVRLFKGFFCDQKGLTLIEYALIAALITLTLVTMLTSMGVTMKSFYATISASLSSA